MRDYTKHRRGVNVDRKLHKQIINLKDVLVGNVSLSKRVQHLSLNYIRNNIVVCDRSDTASNAIQNASAVNGIHYLWICEGDLWVADTVDASIGLCFIVLGNKSPVFIRLPREESLRIMNNGHTVCMAMRTCALTQHQSLSRGTKNHVFTEDGNKYCCIGAQPGRAERGSK